MLLNGRGGSPESHVRVGFAIYSFPQLDSSVQVMLTQGGRLSRSFLMMNREFYIYATG
jgi:hypothetical protein